MAAPEYVPSPAAEQPRVYQSPPRRPDPWVNNRPGDFNGRQPVGPGLGSPGPDQGYALKLARQFEGQLSLADGEHEADAVAGALPVALKRASLFGRAPVVHDLTLAFAVWGYLGEGDDDLVALRTRMFEEVQHPHHYLERRAIADAIPEETLRLTPAQVRLQMATDWRPLIRVAETVGYEAPILAGVPTPVPVEDVIPADSTPSVAELVDAVISPDLIEDDVIEDEVIEVGGEPLPTRAIEPEPAPAPEPAAALVEAEPAPAPPAPEPEPEPVATAEPEPVATAEPEPVATAEPEPVAKAEPEVAPPAPPAAPAAPAPAASPAAAEPATSTPSHADTPPSKRRPVKPVPLDPNEVARLAREAKVAFQKKPRND